MDISSVKTIDLFPLVARDTTLRRTGRGWWSGPCPFCGGVDRFVLKQTSNGWRWLCRHCTDGRYLDALDYVRRRDNLTFAEAVKALGGEVSSPLRELPQRQKGQDEQTVERLTALAFAAARELDGVSPLAAQVQAYLDRRGIIEPTRRRALLGAAAVYDPKAGRRRPAVVIPYLDDALNVRAIKYRFVDNEPSGLRYTAAKGSMADYYYLTEAFGYFDRLLIIEGEINLLSVAQVVPEVDLVSTGSQSLTQSMKQTLCVLAGRYHKIWCWLDDPQKAAEVARLVGGFAVRSPVVDGQKYDANRMLQDDVLHEFISRLTGATRFGWTLEAWKGRGDR